MSSISKNLLSVKNTLPGNVCLVAVSKLHPQEELVEAYSSGQRVFGESRVQELLQKQHNLPKDIEWHFIGHLQTNKVKDIVPFVSLIHGVDSIKLLQAIDKEAYKANRKVSCLLQVHIAQEDTKFGFSAEELKHLLNNGIHQLSSVSICGLMGMATFTDNEAQVRSEFRSLKTLYDELKKAYFVEQEPFNTLSMGMSNDYKIAIEEGSTMVRVGSLIFGERKY